jgi:hypothetical protein
MFTNILHPFPIACRAPSLLGDFFLGGICLARIAYRKLEIHCQRLVMLERWEDTLAISK